MRLLVLLLASCTSACVGIPRYVNPHPATQTRLAVYVESDGIVTPERVLDACTAWTDKGVTCAATRDPFAADITVTSDYQDCPVRNGGRVYGVEDDGRITVFVQCFVIGGGIDRPLLRRILAHEIGHALGLRHVPVECLPGMVFCGPALMNEVPDVDYITPADSNAFDAVQSAAAKRRP